MSGSKATSLYPLFSTLSLDVVTGAVIGAVFVSQLCGVYPDIWFYSALAVSVWIIYTADHLVDAWRLKQASHTDRHLFHHHHFRVLISLVILLAVIDFVLALTTLHTRIIASGLIIFAVSAVYFAALSLLKIRHTHWLQKEIIVALIYTSGVWVGPLALRGTLLSLHEVVLLIMFIKLVLSVLLLYSAIEVEEDYLDDHHTLATRFGAVICHRVIHALLFLLFGMSIYLMTSGGVEIVKHAPTYLR